MEATFEEFLKRRIRQLRVDEHKSDPEIVEQLSAYSGARKIVIALLEAEKEQSK
jgi:hypothetical protein